MGKKKAAKDRIVNSEPSSNDAKSTKKSHKFSNGGLYGQDDEDQQIGCNCPNGCLVGQPIDPEHPEDALKFDCSNSSCTEVPFIHADCYEAWEKVLIHATTHGSGCQRARYWTDSVTQHNLWLKKGYQLIYRFCDCRCTHGHIRLDPDHKLVTADAAAAGGTNGKVKAKLSGSANSSSVPAEATGEDQNKKKKKKGKNKDLPPLVMNNSRLKMHGNILGISGSEYTENSVFSHHEQEKWKETITQRNLEKESREEEERKKIREQELRNMESVQRQIEFQLGNDAWESILNQQANRTNRPSSNPNKLNQPNLIPPIGLQSSRPSEAPIHQVVSVPETEPDFQGIKNSFSPVNPNPVGALNGRQKPQSTGFGGNPPIYAPPGVGSIGSTAPPSSSSVRHILQQPSLQVGYHDNHEGITIGPVVSRADPMPKAVALSFASSNGFVDNRGFSVDMKEQICTSANVVGNNNNNSHNNNALQSSLPNNNYQSASINNPLGSNFGLHISSSQPPDQRGNTTAFREAAVFLPNQVTQSDNQGTRGSFTGNSANLNKTTVQTARFIAPITSCSDTYIDCLESNNSYLAYRSNNVNDHNFDNCVYSPIHSNQSIAFNLNNNRSPLNGFEFDSSQNVIEENRDYKLISNQQSFRQNIVANGIVNTLSLNKDSVPVKQHPLPQLMNPNSGSSEPANQLSWHIKPGQMSNVSYNVSAPSFVPNNVRNSGTNVTAPLLRVPNDVPTSQVLPNFANNSNEVVGAGGDHRSIDQNLFNCPSQPVQGNRPDGGDNGKDFTVPGGHLGAQPVNQKSSPMDSAYSAPMSHQYYPVIKKGVNDDLTVPNMDFVMEAGHNASQTAVGDNNRKTNHDPVRTINDFLTSNNGSRDGWLHDSPIGDYRSNSDLQNKCGIIKSNSDSNMRSNGFNGLANSGNNRDSFPILDKRLLPGGENNNYEVSGGTTDQRQIMPSSFEPTVHLSGNVMVATCGQPVPRQARPAFSDSSLSEPFVASIGGLDCSNFRIPSNSIAAADRGNCNIPQPVNKLSAGPPVTYRDQHANDNDIIFIERLKALAKISPNHAVDWTGESFRNLMTFTEPEVTNRIGQAGGIEKYLRLNQVEAFERNQNIVFPQDSFVKPSSDRAPNGNPVFPPNGIDPISSVPSSLPSSSADSPTSLSRFSTPSSILPHGDLSNGDTAEMHVNNSGETEGSGPDCLVRPPMSDDTNDLSGHGRVMDYLTPYCYSRYAQEIEKILKQIKSKQ